MKVQPLEEQKMPVATEAEDTKEFDRKLGELADISMLLVSDAFKTLGKSVKVGPDLRRIVSGQIDEAMKRMSLLHVNLQTISKKR